VAERSITEILGTLIDRVTAQVCNESALARAEIGENLSHVVGSLSTVFVGAALVLPGVIILLEAMVAALRQAGMTEPWASLLVGGGTIVIGFICISVGINRLKSLNLVPNETIKQLQLDMAVMQEAGKTHDA
jgi:hypothetical protein